jgi:hypothetical protein
MYKKNEYMMYNKNEKKNKKEKKQHNCGAVICTVTTSHFETAQLVLFIGHSNVPTNKH